MAESERRKLLNESLKKINKNHKGTLIKLGSDAKDTEKIPFGIPLLDEFVGGGTKTGAFTVIFGGESVGKSTLTLQAIANAQKLGKICCYIDLEHSYEKPRAKALEVNLEELVLVEDCKTAEDALGIIRTLCQDKVVDLFVVDSVQALSPLNEQENKGKQRQLEEREIAELARTLSKFFKVVAPDVFRAKASVILIGQVRIGGIGTFFTRATMSGGEAIKHWVTTRLFMRRGQTADAPVEKFKETFLDPDKKEHYRTVKKQIGFDCVFKLEKTKSSDSATEGSTLHIPFYYKTGFTKPESKVITMVKEELNSINEVKDVSKSIKEVDQIFKKEPNKRGRKPGSKNKPKDEK